MDTRHCLTIAERMHALLLHELGQGVDGLRMVAEPLYARDVLLVCDAMPGTELAALAQQFRAAASATVPPVAPAARPAAGAGRERARTGDRKDARHDAKSTARASGHGDRHSDPGPGHSSSFGASVLSRLASGFGFSVPGDAAAAESQPDAAAVGSSQRPARRWFSPSRWRDGR